MQSTAESKNSDHPEKIPIKTSKILLVAWLSTYFLGHQNLKAAK